MRSFAFALTALLWGLPLPAFPAEAEAPAEKFEHPAWFKSTFLDLRSDAAEAARDRRRLIVYIEQDGCPYCKELLQNNFARQDIVDLTRQHFDVLVVNMWGDLDVTDFSGKLWTEKTWVESMRVQYTPTLLFFDEQGAVALRLNGYLPPQQFKVALRYVADRQEEKMPFRDYYAQANPEPAASGKLHSLPGAMRPPYDFSRDRAGKPLLVFFEQRVCRECDRLHGKILRTADSRALLKRFDVAVLDMWSDTAVITPAGDRTTAREWSRRLGLAYTPSAVLYGEDGQEVARIEGFLKTFHVESVMDYVASSAYRKEPNFQRYIDARYHEIRKQRKVVIWD